MVAQQGSPPLKISHSLDAWTHFSYHAEALMGQAGL